MTFTVEQNPYARKPLQSKLMPSPVENNAAKQKNKSVEKQKPIMNIASAVKGSLKLNHC